MYRFSITCPSHFSPLFSISNSANNFWPFIWAHFLVTVELRFFNFGSTLFFSFAREVLRHSSASQKTVIETILLQYTHTHSKSRIKEWKRRSECNEMLTWIGSVALQPYKHSSQQQPFKTLSLSECQCPLSFLCVWASLPDERTFAIKNKKLYFEKVPLKKE